MLTHQDQRLLLQTDRHILAHCSCSARPLANLQGHWVVCGGVQKQEPPWDVSLKRRSNGFWVFDIAQLTWCETAYTGEVHLVCRFGAMTACHDGVIVIMGGIGHATPAICIEPAATSIARCAVAQQAKGNLKRTCLAAVMPATCHTLYDMPRHFALVGYCHERYPDC